MLLKMLFLQSNHAICRHEAKKGISERKKIISIARSMNKYFANLLPFFLLVGMSSLAVCFWPFTLCRTLNVHVEKLCEDSIRSACLRVLK